MTTTTLTSDGTTHDAGTTMTLTIDCDTVRQVFRSPTGEVLSDDTAYTCTTDDAEEWVRHAIIDYRTDGWTEA